MPHLRSPARFSMYCFYQLLVRSWLPRGLEAGTSDDFVQFLGGVDCLCRFCSLAGVTLHVELAGPSAHRQLRWTSGHTEPATPASPPPDAGAAELPP